MSGALALGAAPANAGPCSSREISSNWAGYAVVGSDSAWQMSFTSVTATWKQPRVKCGAGDAGASSAVWIGLGGYGSGAQTIEQVGTDGSCNRLGKSTYDAWYELLPSPPVQAAVKIGACDTVTASVNLNATGTGVRLQLKNRTTGKAMTRDIAVFGSDSSSAEWIVEAPSTCGRYSCRTLPLVNFGSVSFTKVATIGNGHAGTITDPASAGIPIQLVPSAGNEFFPGGPYPDTGSSTSAAGAAPVALAAGGQSFTVSWQAGVNVRAL
jgi:hypothetical protein